mmetsp:Transcript_36365/g.59770  ORF Transcript_36365/g.59770 Transcript_36365/m.59770 type:complete len:90 (-) Transcript_36365:59-328(-)
MLLHHHHWISPRILNCQISSTNDQWQEDVYFVIMKVSLIKHRLDPASSLNAGLTGGESTQPGGGKVAKEKKKIYYYTRLIKYKRKTTIS